MKQSTQHARLKNAIVFFAQNTVACGKTKLFKLLFMLDFEHFKQTGKSATGLNYEAWKFGPVPAEIINAWSRFQTEYADAIEIVRERQIDHTRETVKVREGYNFSDEDFTPRQLNILRDLSERFLADGSQAMIDITHEQNGAWDRVWNKGKGDHKPIPYELALPDDAPNRALILESALESRHIAPPATEGTY